MSDKDLFAGCSGKALNSDLRWLNEPERWSFGNDGLEIVPRGKTDFFRPYGLEHFDNACLLYTQVTGNFSAMASVSAMLADFGDAVALTVRSDAEHWLKLCVERSPVGEISIVSVVTNRWSDDSNGELINGATADLRIYRKGNIFGMNYRVGDGKWRFVRTFGYELPETLLVGVHVQAPFQSGCSARIASFSVSDTPVDDPRSGD